VEVHTTRDARLPELHPRLSDHARASSNEEQAQSAPCSNPDWTLLIAPETGGALHERAGFVEESAGDSYRRVVMRRDCL